MVSEQLEFQFDEKNMLAEKEFFMHKLLMEMKMSLDNTRKCVFAKINELENTNERQAILIREMEYKLQRMTNEKTTYLYGKRDCLFDVQENCG
jgi:protein subunit release factor B